MSDISLPAVQAARHCVEKLEQITAMAQLTRGMRGEYKVLFIRELHTLYRQGVVRKFIFDGCVLYAPTDASGDVSFIVRYALDSTRVEVDTGCMHWGGCTHAKKGPILSLGRVEFGLRRCIYEQVKGKQLSSHDAIRMRCEDTSCINPEHMRKEQRNKVLKGRPRSQTTRSRIAAAKRARSEFSMEQVEGLRARYARGEVTQKQAAAELGISIKNTSPLLRGLSWRDFTNPFQGLVS